jgi:hypothetical protein
MLKALVALNEGPVVGCDVDTMKIKIRVFMGMVRILDFLLRVI